ncbi:major facilitator superfamily MFS_1 [Microbacterium esteraromaticum]|uniref:Major facilitator superfamily MFS_1 n=1 Tax=Microbacterium esteraromaticum TaxID=57043 RepID=A0A1R4KJ94_9MICO|nr:MFS transporter [Microbacterium esteraromaticum]SJN44143.1 major facilitator superfamily MFS_1 [Microbacterium esteraromaticum]
MSSHNPAPVRDAHSIGARRRVGAGWMTLFTLAWLAIWTIQLTPVQLLLPLQLNTPEDDWIRGVVSSGLVLGIGGLAGIVAGPAAGAISDRSRSTRGRRRPWALGGVWMAAVFLILTGMAEGPWAVGACWLGVSIGISVASAAFTALIADQLPPAQRGAASSAVGSSQAVGIVLGVGLVVLLGLGVLAGYLLLAAVIAVIGTASALLLPDPPATPSDRPPRQRPRLASLRDRDFSWMLGGRLVTNVGNALGTALFLFFLMHGLGQSSAVATDNLLLLIVVYTVFVVIASVFTGILSDRTGKRRRLTVAATFVQALSGVIVVIAPTFETTMVAAALMGLGYGAFSTVGLAFATDLLPDEQDHARDLGIVNVTAALGQLIGPMLGAALVALVGGFWLVFLMATVLSIVGGLMTAVARQPEPAAAPR